MDINNHSEDYSEKLLADLGLSELSGEQRQQILESLQQRFNEVIFSATVRILPEQLKKEYIQAAMDPVQNEQKIIEITSQVPELEEGIEAALLYEYESLKHSMAKK